MRRVHYSILPSRSNRVHVVHPEDVNVVLSRLPARLWQRLRAVHFNDRSFGVRKLGYVTGGRREITLCALPRQLGLSAFCRWYALSPSEFGGAWGGKWSTVAVRRFMLYEVFLHELGHLQVMETRDPNRRLGFYQEKLAEEFAIVWRRRLWSPPFDHPDPAHNRPVATESAVG